MRAIQIEQFGDPAQVLRVVDIEEPPPPGPHEVLVSVGGKILLKVAGR